MKNTIKDYNYENKKVIVRCDFNVPIENGIIKDDTRIRRSLKTIKYLIDHNAKIIILSHLGKIKEEQDLKNNTLYPVYIKLNEILNTNVYFSHQTRGKELEEKVLNLQNRDVLLIENTRYEDYPNKLESSCDEELSKYWANLGDIFINDAYGTCHRSHASNVGISKYLPSAIGFLIENEIVSIDNFLNEKSQPLIVVMGGKKISDKTLVIDNLVKKCDKILLGGGMCFTFLKAKGLNIGKSIVDENNLEYCKKILLEYPEKIVLPIDIKLKDKKTKLISELEDNDIGYDIGKKTIKQYQNILKKAQRVIINGPMGVYEEKGFEKGTNSIYKILNKNKIKVLIGGGDSAA